MTATRPRIGVIGCGVAGSLLAWRLSDRCTGGQVDLLGAVDPGDATGVSGGLVRAFETDPTGRRLAAASLAELLDSPTLRAWSGYRQIGSVYVVDPADTAALAAARELSTARAGNGDGTGDRAGAGGMVVVDPDELADRHGWRGLPDGCLGVVERRAGNISPDRLRAGVLADLPGRGVTVRPSRVVGIRPEPGGGATVRTDAKDAETRRYDAVVVAAGRWTPRLLQDSGLPDGGFRTKLVQYGVYLAAGPPPPAFVDDTCGLYGRGMADGQVLLGVPVHRFDIDPDHPEPDHTAQSHAAELARSRLPLLRLGRLCRVVAGADCYAEPAGLRLRALPHPGLYTFSGGSGGSAKLALAASAEAAGELARLLGLGEVSGRHAATRVGNS